MNGAPISVTRPVGQAFERTGLILFRPFDLGKWFVLGFCAWLAMLGHGGGGGGNMNFHRPGGRADLESLRAGLNHALAFLHANLLWIAPLAAGLIVTLLALWVLFLWLGSRGEFMFLDGVVHNRAEVTAPWRRYRPEANSLFRFRLAVAGATIVVIWPFLILIGLRVIHTTLRATWLPAEIWSLVNLGLTLAGLILLFALVHKLTRDFVVPIMYRGGGTCLAGWSAFLQLVGTHFGALVLYLLFQLLLFFAALVVILLTVVLTCCIAGCLMALPYLGTVVLLPVLVFFRAYSIHYLAQFGPDFDVFPAQAPPAPAPVPPAGPVPPPAL